jgi:hypothetical protein
MTQAANLGALGTNVSSSGITQAAGGGTGTTAGVTGFKNRIINGAMTIDQRNAGASVTATTANLYTLDRWQSVASVSSKFTIQQDAGAVTPPAGFTDYLGCTSTAATSLGATDNYQIVQTIEGFNIADLGWGTANAKTVTLSFWVRSSLTGTFGGTLTNYSLNRSYPFTYTINSANTWEYETITIAGDTSGSWNNGTNSGGICLRFSLGTGSTYSGTAGAWAGSQLFSATGATSVVGTNGATFYITGVQLEVGSAATTFDYRPYGTEFALCQRYYIQPASTIYAMLYRGDNQQMSIYQYPVTMRATPTSTYTWNADTGVGAGTPTITPYVWFVWTSGTNLSYINPYVTALKLSAEL